MNDELKKKANMAAAKMLGLDKEYELHNSPMGSVVFLSLDSTQRWVGTFDIFHSQSDCLAVVKKLGKEHGIGICPAISKRNFLVLCEGKPQECSAGLLLSYDEAVAIAALEVSK